MSCWWKPTFIYSKAILCGQANLRALKTYLEDMILVISDLNPFGNYTAPIHFTQKYIKDGLQ